LKSASDQWARPASAGDLARPPYVDTSALAKRYLNENRSEELDEFLIGNTPVSISSLTTVEMRSLLARRRREGDVDRALEGRLWAALGEDIAEGFLLTHPLIDEHAAAAVRLLAMLPHVPLRTLDAVHLAIARQIGATHLVTADRVMVAGAEELGFRVTRFD